MSPTSALDPEMIKEVLDVMVELAESGMTMLVVTHEMGICYRRSTPRYLHGRRGNHRRTTPKTFFENPQHERTKLFLSQILHH